MASSLALSLSGLLDVLKSEDEVAFVLAHEISHEIARHTVRVT